MAMNAKRKAEAPLEVRGRAPAREAAYAPPSIENGAFELQRRVSEAFAEDEQRWSPRRALFFMTSASIVCWGLIGAGVAAVLR
ncbi:hypothetical protein LJR225_001522 [Phenylobacterium sp. LjRoot225]|uniref:hypothetical protein n=1 Tax=Phenylobacterium sp. LjRoot225 TaxID=3342285 RepID=UPI003ECED054